jgi:uncharacterized membrane protein HdeD (DUF308 family)
MTATEAIEGRRGPGAMRSNSRRTGVGMILRGIVAVIFGVIALRDPGVAAGAFVLIFAVFAFADGILDFYIAATLGRSGMRWGWYVLAALVSIAAGVIALAYPGITFLVLVLLVGARALVTGVLEIAAAISWRELESRWLLALSGLLSITFGVLLFVSPTVGGVALIWMIGVYAIVLGVEMFALGLRLARGNARLFGTGGMVPAPA